jgi:hypothetical protein
MFTGDASAWERTFPIREKRASPSKSSRCLGDGEFTDDYDFGASVADLSSLLHKEQAYEDTWRQQS